MEISSFYGTQITVEYESTPPQVFLSNLRRTVKDCRNFQVQLQFVEVSSVTAISDEPGRYNVQHE